MLVLVLERYHEGLRHMRIMDFSEGIDGGDAYSGVGVLNGRHDGFGGARIPDLAERFHDRAAVRTSFVFEHRH